jgi:hypothetical protein
VLAQYLRKLCQLVQTKKNELVKYNSMMNGSNIIKKTSTCQQQGLALCFFPSIEVFLVHVLKFPEKIISAQQAQSLQDAEHHFKQYKSGFAE